SVSFSANGKTLLTAGYWESRPRQWDVASGREIQPFPGHRGIVDWLAYADDGKTLFSVGRERLGLRWNLATLRPETLFELPYIGFNRLAVSPDRRTLATLSYEDANVRLWDTARIQQPRILPTHRRPSDPPGPNRPFDLCFSPDGRYLAG